MLPQALIMQRRDWSSYIQMTALLKFISHRAHSANLRGFPSQVKMQLQSKENKISQEDLGVFKPDKRAVIGMV